MRFSVPRWLHPTAGAASSARDDTASRASPTSDPETSWSQTWRSALSAFKMPAFAWYWSSQFISGVGTWSQVVAQSWLVLDLTHSAVALGTITMLQFLPVLAFSLLGGVIADRLPKRRLLVVTQIALSAQAVILAVLVATGVVTYWEVALLALVLGATNALNNPTQQAFVPELVGRELVANAVALNSIQFNGARMIGGAVGGLAIAAWGIAGALFLNAASFLPIVAVLWVVRPRYSAAKSKHAPNSAFFELREGLSYAWSTVSVRRVVVLFTAIGLFGFNWQLVVPLLARFTLHRQATGFGDLMAALGAGSLVGAVLLASNRNASERRLTLGGLALGIVLVLLGLVHSYVAALLLLAVGGFAAIVASVTTNTRLQLLTPDALRGRVMGIYVLLMGGTTPIGAFLLGEIAGHLGVEAGIVAFGAATAIAVAVIARWPSRSSEGELAK